MGLSSLSLVILAIYCLAKYYYISKAYYLSFTLLFFAIIPYIYISCSKLSRFIKITYDKKQNLMLFLMSISLIWFAFGFFIPSQLILSSPQEFSYIDKISNPIYFILYSSLHVFGMFVFWPFCLYYLFSDKIKIHFAYFFASLAGSPQERGEAMSAYEALSLIIALLPLIVN